MQAKLYVQAILNFLVHVMKHFIFIVLVIIITLACSLLYEKVVDVNFFLQILISHVCLCAWNIDLNGNSDSISINSTDGDNLKSTRSFQTVFTIP